VATLSWNGWQFSRGISGSFAVDWVATFVWNQWQFSHEMGGNFAVEYADSYFKQKAQAREERVIQW